MRSFAALSMIVLLLGAAPAGASSSTPTCFGHPATIVGTEDDDRLEGTDEDDVIVGLDGRDIIDGGAGDDLICGGPNPLQFHPDEDDYPLAEELNGGTGNDRIHGGAGIDAIRGGDGDDVVIGGPGADRLTGEAGDDRLRGDAAADFIIGGVGGDHLRGGAGRDSLYSCGGHDRLWGGRGGDAILGGPGEDRLRGGPGRDILDGDIGDDFIHGGPSRDAVWFVARDAPDCSSSTSRQAPVRVNLMRGYGGDASGDERDVFRSVENAQTAFGDDVVIGDNGANGLGGGPGDDVVRGRGGRDLLSDVPGKEGNIGDSDTLFGGRGRDEVVISPGFHAVDGGAGRDRVRFLGTCGDLVADLSQGTAHYTCDWNSVPQREMVATLMGMEDMFADPYGPTTLIGDDAANVLVGGDDDDTIDGRGGDDLLEGHEGNDTLDGGDGTDKASGGAGVDRCSNAEHESSCEL